VAAKKNILPVRGINYDTGVNYDGDALSRKFWHPKAVKRDMHVIAHELHCTAVTVLGTDIERLGQAAEYVLKEGMDAWIQPRLIEGTQEASLVHLGRAAELAEQLRRRYPGKVTLNVGCELSLFLKGILPGKNFQVRMRGLMVYWIIMPVFNRKLNKYLRKACDVARSRFKGPVTYSSGEWEGVDWEPFDYVGVDYYMETSNKLTYVSGLRGLHKHGKPVVITEFGCCSFKGADRKGGGGFMIVKWGNPPTVKPGHERDEQVQADYIEKLAAIYKQEKVYAAFIYAFSEPRNVHTADPRTDLDMASYGVVKVMTPESKNAPEVWEPKAAFARIRDIYQA
jgi:hypothetical protein